MRSLMERLLGGHPGSRCRAILLAVAVALTAAPSLRAGEMIDRVLAVVGGRVITLSDVRAALDFGFVTSRPGQDATSEALAYLVNRELMLAEVDRYSAPSPEAPVLDARLKTIRSRYPSDAAFSEALARTAFTEGRLRDLVSDNLRIEGYLDQRFGAAAEPTAEEVQRYYTDHPAEFRRSGRLVPLEEAQAEAQAKVTAERRNFLIAEWLDRLRRQFSVSNLYTPIQK